MGEDYLSVCVHGQTRSVGTGQTDARFEEKITPLRLEIHWRKSGGFYQSIRGMGKCRVFENEVLVHGGCVLNAFRSLLH